MFDVTPRNWNEFPIMLSVAQVAEILQMGKWTAYNLVHRKDFPAIRIGQHKIRVNKEALKHWIDNQKGTIENEQCS